MTQSRILSNEKGFTIIEALVASVILALGLFAIGAVVHTQFNFVNQNRERAIATLTAQGLIENIRGKNFADIQSVIPVSVDDAPGLGYLHYGSDPGRGAIVVDNASGITTDPNIKRISVTVEWDSLAGRRLDATLTTFVTKNGIDNQ